MVTFEEKVRLGGTEAVEEMFHLFGNDQFSLFKQVVGRLCEMNVPYAMMGGAALAVHGAFCGTREILILVNARDFERLRSQAWGGVGIEFAVAGHFPGYGSPKPVSYPNPALCSIEVEGIRYLKLEKLIEVKLASGMDGIALIGEFGDVQQLIEARNLDEDFAAKLNPYVREKYLELCRGVKDAPHPID